MEFGADDAWDEVPALPAPEGAGQDACLLVSLREFLAGGRFGGVRLGMNKDEVMALAGHPAMFGSGPGAEREFDPQGVWMNGKTTFWFNAGILERIGVYYTLAYPANKAIVYDAPFPQAGAGVASLRSFMQEHGIGFAHRPDVPGASRDSLWTAGGVEIVVVSDGAIGSLVYPPVLTGRAGKRFADELPAQTETRSSRLVRHRI